MPPGRVTLVKPSRRALARWRDRTEWPLFGAAVLFLLAYAVRILHRQAPQWERHGFTAVFLMLLRVINRKAAVALQGRVAAYVGVRRAW